jgi:Na+/melibiose symporter-like transporter
MILNSFAFYFLKPTDIGMMIALSITGSLFYAPTIPLAWAIFADVADYSEWKTGRRATGTIFATIGFALKAGLALGAYGLLEIQHVMHYDPAKITPDVVSMFRVCTTIVPGILFALCTVFFIVYKLDKETTQKIAAELEARRLAAATPAVAIV